MRVVLKSPADGHFQSIDIPSFPAADGNDIDTQLFRQIIEIKQAAGIFKFIHKTKYQDRRKAQVQDLGQCQQLAIQVIGISHVDDEFRMILMVRIDQNFGRDPFVRRIGKKAVSSR